MTIETKSFEGWAIVELMGHVRLAGRVLPAPMFGTELLRIDIPDRQGADYTTQFVSGSSLYRLTPCSEEVARAVARDNEVIPVSPWELRRLEPPKQAMELPSDEERERTDEMAARYRTLSGLVERSPEEQLEMENLAEDLGVDDDVMDPRD